MTSLIIEDRYPLISQRGNFSGKASAFVKSIINGDWWRSSAITGQVPDTVERNAQFYINQGPVDMELFNATPTKTYSSLPANSLIGTFIGKRPPARTYNPDKETTSLGWKEYFIWHVGSKPSATEFSTVPTKY